MSYPQPVLLKFRRFILKRAISKLIRILFRLEINGWENIPKSGGYLVSHNHVSIIDPAWVGSFWPINLEVIGAAELWNRRGQSSIVRLYGTLPVHRGSAERDLLRTMIEVLKSGTPLLIAPEGTRSHIPGLVHAQPGIGYLIDQASVPVLPIGMIGSTDENLSLAFKFKRPKMTMNIGKPFTLPPIEGSGHARREARKKNTEIVMMKICELLPEEYWGVYAEKYKEYRKAESGNHQA